MFRILLIASQPIYIPLRGADPRVIEMASRAIGLGSLVVDC
jgi:hypothetical protein